MAKRRSSETIHARCGRPWAEHRLVRLGDWLEVPRCDDEGEHPGEPRRDANDP